MLVVLNPAREEDPKEILCDEVRDEKNGVALFRKVEGANKQIGFVPYQRLEYVIPDE